SNRGVPFHCSCEPAEFPLSLIINLSNPVPRYVLAHDAVENPSGRAVCCSEHGIKIKNLSPLINARRFIPTQGIKETESMACSYRFDQAIKIFSDLLKCFLRF